MKKIELLAPAGSMESLYGAVNNGADAIYLGGNKFSARAYASNFNNEEIKIAVDYCHSYNIKVYVTINTLLKERELKEAIKYVGYLREIGVDALIVQDLGLVYLIKERYKDFEIHGSTQLTVHNGEGALYFKEKGFKRIVLSRELSLEEIKYISKELQIETEIFIHGALCICYSGKCLISSMIGGRSGNRGRCAQSCRMEYTLKSNNSGFKKGYLLSPKDISTVDIIKEIIDTGTSSLKIEGRMKRPEYVVGVVDNYRKAIDKELKGTKYNNYKGEKELLQLFNREGFSKAYLKGNIGRDMMSYNFPKNTGIEIGKVDNDFNIVLDDDISLGDGVRIKDKGFTISKILINNKEVKFAQKGDIVKVFPKEYKKGDIIFRTSSKELLSELQGRLKPYEKKIKLNVNITFKVNEEIKLITKYNNKTYLVYGEVVEEASNKPLDKDRIVKALQKSGDYPFKIEHISFEGFNDGFIKISSLNNLRRDLFEDIIKNKLKEYRKRDKAFELSYSSDIKDSEEIEYLYTCTTKTQLNTLIQNGAKNIALDIFQRGKDTLQILDLHLYKDIKFYILTPEIIKGEFMEVVEIINKCEDKIRGLVTSNLGLVNIYKDKLKLIGDYKLNVFNSKALEFYKKDFNNITLSVESNRGEIKEILKDNKSSGAMALVYGKVEVMISEYCPIGSTFGGKNKSKECSYICMKDEFTLVDRMKEEFRVLTDKFCRSHILNSVPLNLIEEISDLKSLGVSSFRVDFKDENEEDVNRILDFIKNGNKISGKNYTKGHYKRGVE